MSDFQNVFFDNENKAVWAYRIMGVIFINLFGFMDRTLTEVAVVMWGINVEQNPIMKFLNINPWIGLASGLIVSTVLLLCMLLPKDNKAKFFADCALVLMLITEFIVIFNNILQFAGGIKV